MTLVDYLRALKRGWLIILCTFLVVMACAAVVVLRKTDVYTASTELFVASSTHEQADAETAYQTDLFAQERVASYAIVAGGSVVRDQAKEKVGGDLNASVAVTQLPGTVVLLVTATSGNAEDAAAAAQAYADVIPSAIEGIDAVNGNGPAVDVTVTDKAAVPTAPAPQSNMPTIVAAICFGLGLGVAIVLVLEVLRRDRERERRAGAAPAEKSSEVAGA